MENPNPEYTLDEALSNIGFGKLQSFLLLYGALGWIAEAMELMILSYIGPALRSGWGLSPSEESLLSTFVFTGMLIGANMCGHISDTWGRKRGILVSATISSSAGLLSAFSPSYLVLVTLRFITGIGLGGAVLFTSWFLEFVPTAGRGSWMMITTSFWTFGTIFEASLAWIVMPRWGWRWLVGLSSLGNFLVLLFYKLVPESPRYLVTKGRLKEAQNILEKAAQINGTNVLIGTLSSDKVLDVRDEVSPREDTYLLSSSRKEINETKGRSPPLSVLFSRKLIRTTLLLCFLHFGNTFSYYGILLLISELSAKQNKCEKISMLSGSSQDSHLYIDVFVTNLAELPGLVFAAIIVDRVGRKVSIVILLMLGFVMLLPLVAQQNGLLTISLLFGARMFIAATFDVACIYAPEVYPTNIRASGVGLANSIGKIGGMVAPLIAVGLVSNCHLAAAVVLFSIMMMLSGLSVMFIPLETKGWDLIDTA